MRPEDVAYWQEYAKAYSYFDVKELVVLDIGADIGSSAVWFLQHGAKKVICYSLEQQGFFDERIEWHGEWNGEYIPADLLKMDCEGCECKLSIELLNRYKYYYVAIHTGTPCFEMLKAYLDKNAVQVFTTTSSEGVTEIMYAGGKFSVGSSNKA